jgi:3-oxosteroid 1-dehydrogenase
MNEVASPLPHPDSFALQPEYDFVVVGSGGASMCAALVAKAAGLEVAIIEKQEKIGGSTSLSGGAWWVPNNHVMKRAGADDSADRARSYFDAVVDFVGRGTTPARRTAFLEQAPRMVQFLEEAGMRFDYGDGWSDYYDERPGGHPRGRSLLAEPFDLNRLGPWKDKLAFYGPFRHVPFGSHLMFPMLMFMRSWAARRILLRLIATIAMNTLRGRDVTANGGAIQARMLEMTVRRKIPVITGFGADTLIQQDGRVIGVGGHYRGKRVSVRARRGVLLNTGGFSRNDVMRQKYQRKPTSARWTLANAGDTGEMLEEAMRIGAATENLDAAIWLPTSLNPDLSPPAGAVAKDGSVELFPHNGDISCPHLMIVDRAGKRFLNEAQSYVEIGETMYRHGAIPAFAVFDQRHMKRYFWGLLPPFAKPLKVWRRSGFLIEADSIEELARKAGVDPAGLAAEVSRFNGFARAGIDQDFHRGERAYDRWRGDPTVKPNPCLGEIAQAPFYAIRIFPADVGTFGGVVTDEHARVLRNDGSVIKGLYAAGNCTSSVMGRTYPGGGASISASFVFGYIAAKHAAAANADGVALDQTPAKSIVRAAP